MLAAVSNGHDLTSEMGYAVSEALKVSVSLWPIAFAAIVAQSLRAFASFKAERGLKLIVSTITRYCPKVTDGRPDSRAIDE